MAIMDHQKCYSLPTYFDKNQKTCQNVLLLLVYVEFKEHILFVLFIKFLFNCITLNFYLIILFINTHE